MKDTVLIVNENVNARIIAETLLQSRGISAVSAEDSLEALDLLERDRSIGVLLIDLDEMSPGKSGWELLRNVRRRFGGVSVDGAPRIVVQSERRESETESFVRHLGAEVYLRKPTAPADLLDSIGALLERPEVARLRLATAR
jgi:DNA-binding response OmpR family regulator